MGRVLIRDSQESFRLFDKGERIFRPSELSSTSLTERGRDSQIFSVCSRSWRATPVLSLPKDRTMRSLREVFFILNATIPLLPSPTYFCNVRVAMISAGIE